MVGLKHTLKSTVYLKVKVKLSGFGGLDVAWWPLVHKFVGFLGRKNPQHAFLPSEEK
jgi:hypothetical protein